MKIGKRNLRFYFALWFAKATALALKIIGRKGTSMPGSWAIMLCPDFIGRMRKPEKILAVTGTNGKTTVANMVEEVLESQGMDFVCNKEGSNMPTGVASALIANSTFFGRPKKQLAVFEIDERSSVRIYPCMKPDILVVTNIFRDSYRRNAHTEYIFNILDKYIPDGTELILNGDDPQCSSLKKGNKRVYFGIDKLGYEAGNNHNIVKDGANCPICSTELEYSFVRYHHIGQAHCPNCGYATPEADYRVVSADPALNKMVCRIHGEEHEFKLLDETPINIYNQAAAIAMLNRFGMSVNELQAAFNRQEISESRLSKTVVNGRTIVRHLAKGQNPVACSRAMDNTRNMPGRKCVMMFLDDHFDAVSSVENIAWYYDTDFEFLNDEGIKQILVGGVRHYDTYLRLLMAGIPEERIRHAEDNMKIPDLVDFDACDTFVIYYDVYTIGLSKSIENQVIEKIKGADSDNE